MCVIFSRLPGTDWVWSSNICGNGETVQWLQLSAAGRWSGPFWPWADAKALWRRLLCAQSWPDVRHHWHGLWCTYHSSYSLSRTWDHSIPCCCCCCCLCVMLCVDCKVCSYLFTFCQLLCFCGTGLWDWGACLRWLFIFPLLAICIFCAFICQEGCMCVCAVSYTHLTLPTSVYV